MDRRVLCLDGSLGHGKRVLDILFIKLNNPPKLVQIPGLPDNVVPIVRNTKTVQCVFPSDHKESIERQPGKTRAEGPKLSQTLKVPLSLSLFSTYTRQDLSIPPITPLGTTLQVSRAALPNWTQKFQMPYSLPRRNAPRCLRQGVMVESTPLSRCVSC